MSTYGQSLMYIYQTNEPLLIIPIAEIDSIIYSAVGDPGALALVTTLPMSSFTSTTATIGGIVDPNGGTAITDRGVVWSTDPEPTTADSVVYGGIGSGTFSVDAIGLEVGLTYYAKAYAINNAGIAYGNQVTFFVTNDPYILGDSITDVCGNIYPTIHTATGQKWMAENLKTCKYANGDSIMNVPDDGEWSNLISGAWTYYNNNSQMEQLFGRLYNGWSVDDPRNVCPDGWHVPTLTDWQEFHAINGGQTFGGGALKSIGTTLWLAPNTGATNSSGFTGFPGGRRLAGGSFQEIYGSGFWWTSSGNSSILECKTLYYTSNGVWTGSLGKLEGASIRCVND
ncbi:MAG: fibrobacter succinogenes major paralogous domain-containing protein [Flavobacteriales bacterium]|nr:fibrobacter succinogenes major paralogous domain-containing protein [Flavobacteriales bacterium]